MQASNFLLFPLVLFLFSCKNASEPTDYDTGTYGLESSEATDQKNGVTDEIEKPTKRILIIGDSHLAGLQGNSEKQSGDLSCRLDQFLSKEFLKNEVEEQKTMVAAFGVSGSSPKDWISGTFKPVFGKRSSINHKNFPKNTKYTFVDGVDIASGTTNSKIPRFSELIKTFKPTTVIIMHGSNMWYYSESQVNKYVKVLVDLVDSSISCNWVGIPHYRNKINTKKYNKDFSESKLRSIDKWLSSANMSKCNYISTLDFVQYPDAGGDGLHYGTLHKPEYADKWAKSVAEKLVIK